MRDQYPEWRQAEGKIQIGLNRLAEDYPFHTKVLEQFKLVCRPEVGTMGVSVCGDNVLLYYNPAFVLDTRAPELGGVLLHEVHHVVLGHVLAKPTTYADRWARVVA